MLSWNSHLKKFGLAAETITHRNPKHGFRINHSLDWDDLFRVLEAVARDRYPAHNNIQIEIEVGDNLLPYCVYKPPGPAP